MNTKISKIFLGYAKKILLLIIIMLTSTICFADIRGRIVSKKDSNPIPFAKIEFLPYNQVTLSNKNGYFLLETSEKEGELKVSSIGYKIKVIKISPNISSEFLIKLEIKPIEISGINVKAEGVNSLTYLSGNVESIEIEHANTQTIPDLLRKESGITVRSCLGNSKFTSVDIRGFGETAPSNALILVDGRRANEIDISGVDWAQLPLSSIEKIEIIKGGASVIYGDNATGGVINLMTKKGKGKPYINTTLLTGNYGMWSPKIEAGGKIKNFSYFLNADYYNTDGYRRNNFFTAYDFGGNFDTYLTNTLDLSVSTNYHKDKYGMPGALSETYIATNGRQSTNTPSDKGITKDWFVKLDGVYNIMFAKDNWGVFSTSISYRNRKSHADFVSLSSENENNISTFCITPKFTFNKKIMWQKHTFTLGLDSYSAKDKIFSDGIGFTGQYRKDVEIAKNSLGFFVNEDFSIIHNLILNLGYRYEIVKYKFDQKEDIEMLEARTISTQVVNTIINYMAKDFSIFAKFSQSFRFPAVDEFFSVWTGLNTALVHQSADEYEIGIKKILLNKMLCLKCSLSQMNITNEIYYNLFTYTNENYGKTKHKGLDFEITFMPFEFITLFTNHTYTKAKFQDGDLNGNHIPGVPQNKDVLGVKLMPSQNLTFSFVSNYVGKRYFMGDLNNATKPLKPYITSDIKIELKNGNLSTSFGVNNIFNEKYSEYSIIYYSGGPGNFYPSPERNFIGELSYKF
jgi:iron complex outermembrane receptor protein